MNNSKIIQIGIPEPDRCGSTSCQVCFVGERYKYVSHLFQGQLVQLPTLKASRHNEMAIWISATMWWLHHGDPASQWRWGSTQKYRLLHSNWHRSSWPVFLQQYPQISKASDVTPCTCIKSSYVRNLLGQIAQHVWCSNSFWQSSQFQARSAWLFIRHGPEQSSRFSAKVTGSVGWEKLQQASDRDRMRFIWIAARSDVGLPWFQHQVAFRMATGAASYLENFASQAEAAAVRARDQHWLLASFIICFHTQAAACGMLPATSILELEFVT